MNIDYIYEFVRVSSFLNFTTAANSLHISQPSLSRHIAELESDAGFALLERNNKNDVKLTAAGSAFLEYAIPLCSIYGMIQKDIAALKDEPTS